jgi:multiple sugar transport system permease protein
MSIRGVLGPVSGGRKKPPETAPERAGHAGSGPRHDRRRLEWRGLVLLAPGALVLAVMFIGPVVYAIYIGFTNLQLLGPTAQHFQFTGLTNLRQLIHDPFFWHATRVTFVFIIGSGVLGATGAGLVLALLMRASSRVVVYPVGMVTFIAFVLPPLNVALLWTATTSNGGILGNLFGGPQHDLLQSKALLVVGMANAWTLAGFSMIVYMAAMRNIPAEMYDAATMERASSIQRFLRLTMPLLRPTTVLLILFNTLLSLGNYAIILIMTGPLPATEVLPVYSYQQGFLFQNLAYGALIGDAMILIAGILAALFVRSSRVPA